MISFVIPAYNEERYIGATIDAVRAAARAAGVDFEVVVVDDASSDRTASVAQSRAATVIAVANRQIAATRNAGARASIGDLLIFVDADTLVSVDVVREAIDAVAGGAIGGGAHFRFDGRVPPFARIVTTIVLSALRAMRLGAGCFLFCTRDAFGSVGGFDERLFGAEDLAISRALKRRGRFVLVPHRVITSGRKVRAVTGWRAIRLLGALLRHPRRSVGTRTGPLKIWYDERPDEPDATGAAER